MPCYDPETHERPVRLEEKVHHLTALLCGLCRKLEESDSPLIKENAALTAWWKNHKEKDRLVAEINEKERTEGWKSLTHEELSRRYDAKDISR